MSVPTIKLERRCWLLLAPKWAYRPLSGAGAALHGGRFNAPGTEALYISEDYITAICEYEQKLGIRLGTLGLSRKTNCRKLRRSKSSFNATQHKNGVNIVLWHWNTDLNRNIRVLDPRTGLPIDQSSWNV